MADGFKSTVMGVASDPLAAVTDEEPEPESNRTLFMVAAVCAVFTAAIIICCAVWVVRKRRYAYHEAIMQRPKTYIPRIHTRTVDMAPLADS
eukprot:367945_1